MTRGFTIADRAAIGWLIWILLLVCEHAHGEDYEILIRRGTVVDGRGGPSVQADVAIREGKIAAVGKLDNATAREMIDASNRVVCPGFVDLHSHADRGVLKFRAAENYIRQGVTTLVCGNCGSSPVDVAGYVQEVRAGGTGPNI